MSDQTFFKVLTAEFAKKPNLKKMDEATREALAEAFEGWKEIAAYEQDTLMAVFAESETPLTEAQSKAIIALAKSESAGGDKVTVEMSGAASAVAVAGVDATPFGPYAAFLTRGPSAALGGIGPVNPRIKTPFVQAAARCVATFIYLATGVDRGLFNQKFWEEAEIEDLEVRGPIFELTEQIARGEFITVNAMQKMFTGIDGLLDEQFKELVDVCADFAGAQEVLGMTHQGGEMDLTRFAAPMAKMGILVPATAAKISKAMVKSSMPEASGATSKMIAAMMNIMRGPNFAPAVRAPVGLTSDEAAVWFMESRMGESFTNRIALAQAYERVLNLFAVCPPVLAGPEKSQYLLTVGTVANEVGAYHALVDPEIRKEVQQAGKASGFQTPVASVPTKAVARAWFDIKLSVTWGRG